MFKTFYSMPYVMIGCFFIMSNAFCGTTNKRQLPIQSQQHKRINCDQIQKQQREKRYKCPFPEICGNAKFSVSHFPIHLQKHTRPYIDLYHKCRGWTKEGMIRQLQNTLNLDRDTCMEQYMRVDKKSADLARYLAFRAQIINNDNPGYPIIFNPEALKKYKSDIVMELGKDPSQLPGYKEYQKFRRVQKLIDNPLDALYELFGAEYLLTSQEFFSLPITNQLPVSSETTTQKQNNAMTDDEDDSMFDNIFKGLQQHDKEFKQQ